MEKAIEKSRYREVNFKANTDKILEDGVGGIERETADVGNNKEQSCKRVAHRLFAYYKQAAHRRLRK